MRMLPTPIVLLEPLQATEEVFVRVHEIAARCHTEANRLEPYRPYADTIAYLRYPPASEPRRYWVGILRGEIAGFAQLALPAGSPVAEASILVLPEARRHGLGQALYETAAERAAAAGRTTLIGQHATDAGARFAARLDAKETRCDVRSVLVLSEAELDTLPIEGYRLQSWNGAAPEQLVASYAAAREAINDAPAATENEWHAWDVAKVRDLERVLAQRRRQVRVTAALDQEERVVGYTEPRVSDAAGVVASTEDTAVVGDHRGRGLAHWVKAESLRLLRRERPDVRLVATTNAEANAPIRAVNTALGFRPAAVYTTCRIDLRT